MNEANDYNKELEAQLQRAYNSINKFVEQNTQLQRELARYRGYYDTNDKYTKLQFYFGRLQTAHNSLVTQHKELALKYYSLIRRNTPPLNRMPEEMEIYRGQLAGVQFTQYLTAEQLGLVSTACELQLVPEPENPHDDKAIGVWVPNDPSAGTRFRIGYIKRVDNAIIHAFLERGIKLTTYLHIWDQDARPWNRYTIRVVAPSIINK